MPAFSEQCMSVNGVVGSPFIKTKAVFRVEGGVIMKKTVCMKIYIVTTIFALFISLLNGRLCGTGFVNTASDTTVVQMFPTELRIIHEDAFSGTRISEAVFGDRLAYIGRSAFSRNDRLKTVYIPKSVKHIGASAFPTDTVVHGPEGSYAEYWSEDNGYRFVADDIWNDKALAQTIRIELLLFLRMFVFPADIGPLWIIRKRIKEFRRSMRPQDRPELYPIDYRFP